MKRDGDQKVQGALASTRYKIIIPLRSLGVTSLVWQTFHSVPAPSIDRTYRPEKKVGRFFEFEEIYNVHENTSFIKRERERERETETETERQRDRERQRQRDRDRERTRTRKL